MADPGALPLAVAAYQAAHFIGMPECGVCLAQCVVHLARAPKNISVYEGWVVASTTARGRRGRRGRAGGTAPRVARRRPLSTPVPASPPGRYKKATGMVTSWRGAQPAVPLHIRNAPTSLMKRLGYAKDYKYTPKEDSAGQSYLPEALLAEMRRRNGGCARFLPAESPSARRPPALPQ